MSDKNDWRGFLSMVKPYGERNNYVEEGANKVRIEVLKKEISHKDKPVIHKRLKGGAQEATKLKAGDLSPLSPSQARQLRKGKLRADYTVDLHGKKYLYAKKLVISSICQAYSSGFRLLLFITGKGRNKDDGKKGVLKESFSDWINDDSCRHLILSYCLNPRGEGSFYVYLRRRE